MKTKAIDNKNFPTPFSGPDTTSFGTGSSGPCDYPATIFGGIAVGAGDWDGAGFAPGEEKR